MSWYRVGKVSITKGQKTLIGYGTKWADNKHSINRGHIVLIPGQGSARLYEIEDVKEDGLIVLTTPFEETSVNQVGYSIINTLTSTVPDFAVRLAAQLKYNQELFTSIEEWVGGKGDVTIILPNGETVVMPSVSEINKNIETKISKNLIQIPANTNLLTYFPGKDTGFYSSGGLMVNGPISSTNWMNYRWTKHGIDYGILEVTVGGASGEFPNKVFTNIYNNKNWSGWSETFKIKGGNSPVMDYPEGSHGYLSWSEGGKRQSLVGYTANGQTSFEIRNEKTNGNVNILTNGTGKVMWNGTGLVKEGQDGFHGNASNVRLDSEADFLAEARDRNNPSKIFRRDQPTPTEGIIRYAPSFLFKAGDTWANISVDFNNGRLTTRGGNSSGGVTSPSRSYLFSDEVWTRKESDDRYLQSISTGGGNNYGTEQWSLGGLYGGVGRWVKLANITGGSNSRYLFRLSDTRASYNGNGVTDSSFVDIAITVENGNTKAKNFGARVYVYSDAAKPSVRIEQISVYNANIWVYQPQYSSYTVSALTTAKFDRTFAEKPTDGLPEKPATSATPETATYNATPVDVYTGLNSSGIVSRITKDRQSIVSEFEAKERIDAMASDGSYMRLFALNNGNAGIAFRAANGTWMGDLQHPRDGNGTIATREWVQKGNAGMLGELYWDQKPATTYAEYINTSSTDANTKNYLRRWRSYRSGTLYHEVAEFDGLTYYHGGEPTNFISKLSNSGHLTLRNGLTVQDTITSGGGIRATVQSGSFASWTTRGAGLQVATTTRNGASSIFKLIDGISATPIISFGGYSTDGAQSGAHARLEVGGSYLHINPGKFEFGRELYVLRGGGLTKVILEGDQGFTFGQNMSETRANPGVLDFDSINLRSGPYRVTSNSKGTRPKGFTGGFHLEVILFGDNYVAQTANLFSNGNGKSYRRTYNPSTSKWSDWIGIMFDGDYGIGAGSNITDPDTVAISDFNNATTTAFYKSDDNTTNAKFGYSPMLNMTRRGGSDSTGFCTQIQVDPFSGQLSTRGRASGKGWSVWRDAYSSNNTTVDSNGFIKKASPIVKLYSNRLELNEESEGVILNKVGEGHYIIGGVLGFNSDGAWGVNGGVVVPKDENDQSIMWVKTKVLKDGDIEVKTYHRQHKDSPEMFQNFRIKEVKEGNPVYYEDGEVVDIPDNTWIDLRVEMPEDSIYNTKQKVLEKEIEKRIKEESRIEALSSIKESQDEILNNDKILLENSLKD